MYGNQFDPYGHRQPNQGPQLFEDTSGYGYPNQGYSGYNTNSYNNGPQGPAQPNQGSGYGGGIPGTQFIQNPIMADMAMQYGQALVGQGREMVDKKLEKYVSVSKVKYYFAVDTSYVVRKLRLVIFPFAHSDWSVHYESDEPVQPRLEINAPDLYIPLMSFVTYVLMLGICLGIQQRFSPDLLGKQATSALIWLFFEVLVILFTLYVTAIQTSIRVLDLTAFCSYKYVGMILCMLGSITMDSFGYYTALGYCSFSLAVFLFRTLRWQIQQPVTSESGRVHGYSSVGNKRRLYLLVAMTAAQPLMMFWHTYYFSSYAPPL